jgi:hypothetical protein
MQQTPVEYAHGHNCGAIGYSSVNHFGVVASEYSDSQQALFHDGFMAGKAERIIKKPYQLPTMHKIHWS